MIWQTCKMSWAAVCANKLRTFLTMLGIIIGVSALIVLVSIADGASWMMRRWRRLRHTEELLLPQKADIQAEP